MSLCLLNFWFRFLVADALQTAADNEDDDGADGRGQDDDDDDEVTIEGAMAAAPPAVLWCTPMATHKRYGSNVTYAAWSLK